MLPISLWKAHHDVPSIRVNSPYEPFGEFLKFESTVKNAEAVLRAAQSVLPGEREEAEILQNYGVLALDHASRKAHVCLGGIVEDDEIESEMPLELFRDIAEEWLAFVRQVMPDTPGN